MSEQPVQSSKGKGLTVTFLMIIMALGLVVAYNYVIFMQRKAQNPRLPTISRVERDLVGTNQALQEVNVGSLKGQKVLLVSQVFTRCQSGCAKVTQTLKDLLAEFGPREPDLHVVSVSLDPAIDPPELLKTYAESFGADPNRWWMISSDKKEARFWLDRQIKFTPTRDIPEDERLNEFDLFDHDLRIALVDKFGHVRGYYKVALPNQEWAEAEKKRLREDLIRILEEAKNNFNPAKPNG